MGSEDKAVDKQHFCHLELHSAVSGVPSQAMLPLWIILMFLQKFHLAVDWFVSDHFSLRVKGQTPNLILRKTPNAYFCWMAWVAFVLYVKSTGRANRLSEKRFTFFWSMFCDSSLQFINHHGHTCTTNRPLSFQRNTTGLGNLLTGYLYQNTNSSGSSGIKAKETPALNSNRRPWTDQAYVGYGVRKVPEALRHKPGECFIQSCRVKVKLEVYRTRHQDEEF